MARLVDELVTRLTMDTTSFESGARRAGRSAGQLEGNLDDVGSTGVAAGGSLKQLGVAAAGLFSAGAVARFANDSIQAFSRLEESTNAVNVIFEDGADIIRRFAQDSINSVGLAESAYQQFAANVGGLLGTAIDDTSLLAEETNNLLVRASDAASVFDTDVNEAITAFGAALRGESEPARRFNIQLSAARVEAKALELGLGDASGALTEQEKVLARLAIVYEDTDKIAGDFANTIDSTANTQKRAQQQAEQLRAEVGERLAPAYTTLLDTSIELAPVVTELAVSLASVVEVVGPLTSLLDALNFGTEETADGATNVGRAFDDALGSMLPMVPLLRDINTAIEEAEGRFKAGGKELDGIEKSAGGAARAFRNVEDPVEDLAADVKTLTDRLGTYQSLLVELADPAVAAARAAERAQEAQTAYDEAVSEFGDTSREAAEADLARRSAILESNAALAELERDGPAAYEALASAVGDTTDDVKELLTVLGVLNDQGAIDIPVNLKVNLGGLSADDFANGFDPTAFTSGGIGNVGTETFGTSFALPGINAQGASTTVNANVNVNGVGADVTGSLDEITISELIEAGVG